MDFKDKRYFLVQLNDNYLTQEELIKRMKKTYSTLKFKPARKHLYKYEGFHPHYLISCQLKEAEEFNGYLKGLSQCNKYFKFYEVN